MLFSVKCARIKTTLPRLLVNVILCGFLCQNKTARAAGNPEDGNVRMYKQRIDLREIFPNNYTRI